MADPTDYAALASSDARSRLEMAVELLRREWRDGCPAGMAYQTALGLVHQLRQNAAIDPTERSRRPIPIETRRYIGAEREAAYTLVREEVAKGHQVFVIYPLVEEAVEEAERLSQWVFPDLRIDTLHGRMKSRDKDAVMTDFRDRHYDVLVAASVIELGIDIPNATVMLIEGADRFGLAQLHQFRWWLARGDVQSYCVLIAEVGSPDSEQRLETMVATNDIFLLAEKGLALGGPGDFIDTRQSGLSDQIVAELAAVIADLEAYAGLPVEDRLTALKPIADAINRLIPHVATPSALVHSVPTIESQSTPVTRSDNRANQTARSGRLLSPSAVITRLHCLSPSDFERVVASLLQAQGYTGVRVTGGADDRGVDIIGIDTEGRLVAVQCKRFAPTSTVHAQTVQTLFGMSVKAKAHRAMLVTTGSFTAPARTQGKDFDVELIDGQQLAALIAGHPHLMTELSGSDVVDGDALAARDHESRTVTRYPEPDVSAETRHPDPNVPVVLPPASAARHARLMQLLPQTPVISAYAQWPSTTTEEEKRAWPQVHEQLLAMTPEQFRKVCVLTEVAAWDENRPEIRLLEHQNGAIKDYALMMRPRPWLIRCHHLSGEEAVTAEQTDQFIRFAEAHGYEAKRYSTTGLFTAAALLQQIDRGLSGLPTMDGWHKALWLIDMHWPSKGIDFIALAEQPGWPKNTFEGTERRGVLRRLFG